MAKSNLTNRTHPEGDDPGDFISYDYDQRYSSDDDSPRPGDYSHVLFREWYNTTENRENNNGGETSPLI